MTQTTAKDTVQDNSTRITETALKAIIAARKTAMLVGPPGVGKTAFIRRLAEDMGYDLITLIGSRIDSTDIAGIPSAAITGTKPDGTPINETVYLPTHWQGHIMRHKKVVLFGDEYSNTPSSVRASLLSLFQDREFPNGDKIPDETIIIAAMNPSSQAADGYELDLPTSNRMSFINWNPSTASWVEGMRTNWGKPCSPEEKSWKHKVAKFIHENPSYLHVEPSDSFDDDKNPRLYGVDAQNPSALECFRNAWPSRRSWDNVTQILAENSEPNDVIIEDTLLQSTVGYSATAAFRDWLRKNSSIDPKDVLEDPEIIDWQTIKVDDSNLILRAINNYIDESNSQKAINVYRVIAAKDRTYLAASFIGELISKCTSKTLSRATIEENRKLLRELAPLYRGIGHTNDNGTHKTKAS